MAMFQSPPSAPAKSPEKSAYFAFVDRQYVFTLEMVGPGVPILNFISMIDEESVFPAKNIRLTLGTRRVAAKFFLVDTSDPDQPVIVPSVRMRPRSSFGMRLQGEFGEEKEIRAVTVQIGPEEFQLVPLSSLDFENLVLKVNRLNLGSPDFRDDWRILKLETMGHRAPTRRR
jgi:hypothetical protein